MTAEKPRKVKGWRGIPLMVLMSNMSHGLVSIHVVEKNVDIACCDWPRILHPRDSRIWFL
ncbi:hypothetical protein SLEP1_g49578 [Rubroshorea leprosula]|uniref:Uncharacterized protein n=1 Tax=Rubroshorea leprosula TaxID=152421 RepID=A0AAV5LX88_9ROSI|nr:hypothetical protein SLEP1_g49578 [Rubroshorea leprosula]